MLATGQIIVDFLALGAGVLVVGLSGLPVLDLGPRRSILIGWVAAFWVAVTLVGMWFAAATLTGVGLDVVSVSDMFAVRDVRQVEFLCAVIVVILSFLRGAREEIPAGVTMAVAAIGIVVVPIFGHASGYQLGVVLIAVHALAAAWWVGTLAALALSTRGRRGWAAVLPTYSRYALYAVAALAVSGIAAAIVVLPNLHSLVDTTYGRLVVAKAALLAVLLGLAGWWRRAWVPRAARHQYPERSSLRNATAEVLLQVVVMALAVWLAATPNP